MDVKFAHLCDYASVSREGKLSVMGIFSNINVRELPTTHPVAYLAFEIEVLGAELDRESTLEVDIVDADGDSIFKMEGKFKGNRSGRPGERRTMGQILSIGGMAFKRDGRYNINIFLNNQLKKTVEFSVSLPPASKQDPDKA